MAAGGGADAILAQLKDLADEFVVRDARKLLQLARSQGVDGGTTALAAQALRSDVARQVLAPPPRATGKSAAPRPDSTLQEDLIDFSLNLPPTKEGNRYLAVLSDISLRASYAQCRCPPRILRPWRQP